MLLVFNSFNSMNLNKIESIDPYFTLVFKTNSGGVRPDYGYKLQEQLELVGINLTVIVQDWPTFVAKLIIFRDFDLFYVCLQGGGKSPDYTGIYDENGSLNLFGYSTDMDYHHDFGTGINQWYMDFGNLMIPSDSANRIQHYWDWEQYMMNNILPLQSTFTPYYYTANWANLDGYDVQNDLIQSWGKMSWNGAHSEQASLNEIVYSDGPWSDLNLLFQDDAASARISKATLDPLIWYDSDATWQKQKHDDLQGKYVFVSGKRFFHYFGSKPLELPSTELINILYCDIGHKCIADPEVPQEFLDFIHDFKKQKKIGFVSPPEIWLENDESWKQCEPKE